MSFKSKPGIKEEDTVNFVLVASRAKEKRTGNMFFFSVFIVAEQMARY